MKRELIQKARKVGIDFPEIMMPDARVHLPTWSVIACDQYTSEPAYWSQVEALVGKAPSTLHLALPEIYLDKPEAKQKIDQIHQSMREYLQQGVLSSIGPGAVYTERQLKNGKIRKGLVLNVDLEHYEFQEGTQSLIRATEKTVLERIPPRMAVRGDASVETPHILILIDDAEQTVVEPLGAKKQHMKRLYDFELMAQGGHICGYHVTEEALLNPVIEALEKLQSPEVYAGKYPDTDVANVMVYAVGDGNHSLATAKTHWENLKKRLSGAALQEHPARYALVECMNLHEASLVFEAIHRVVFNIAGIRLLEKMAAFLPHSDYKLFDSEAAQKQALAALDHQKHVLPFYMGEQYGYLCLHDPGELLTVSVFEKAYEGVAQEFAGHHVDYIHGEDSVKALAQKPGNIGFLLPAIDKKDLFPGVLQRGTLPKKTFSMGEANEKRFYLECRKIIE